MSAERDEPGDDRLKVLAPRSLFAEFLGTGLLTLVTAGADVAAHLGSTSSEGAIVASGLTVSAMIFTLGSISGAHINPAVTLGFALRGDFPWRGVPGYWLAQLAGAVGGAIILKAIFGTLDQLGATSPHLGTGPALAMEVILTFLLVTVILAVSARAEVAGHNAAFAVGSTVILDGLFGASVSGASMNPARSFGPAIVSGQLADYWVYLLGPIAGSILAVGVAWLLRGQGSPHARNKATGQHAEREDSQ